MDTIQSKKNLHIRIYMLLALVVLVLHTWLYLASPFSGDVSRVLLNSLTIISSGFSAVLLTMILHYFQKDEPPFLLWLMFAIAVWAWVLGEFIWAYYSIADQEVPGFTGADVAWLLGYLFYTIAMLRQYQLIFPQKKAVMAWLAALTWLVVLALTGGLLVLFDIEPTLEDFVAYFYPVADLAIGVAALLLVFKFGQGWLARPWLSLFAFVVADALFVAATTTGLYEFSMQEDVFSLLVDTSYMLAYLVLGWGVFQQYLFLKLSYSIQAE